MGVNPRPTRSRVRASTAVAVAVLNAAPVVHERVPDLGAPEALAGAQEAPDTADLGPTLDPDNLPRARDP